MSAQCRYQAGLYIHAARASRRHADTEVRGVLLVARGATVLVGDRLLDMNGLLATELRDLLTCWGELAEFFLTARLDRDRAARRDLPEHGRDGLDAFPGNRVGDVVEVDQM
jgi:hypothetical protein